MSGNDLKALARFAERLADASGEVIRAAFRGTGQVQVKADATPVTATDRKVEAVLRAMIEAECPQHGIMGEEFDDQGVDAQYVWVIDPIDGTKAFAAGLPCFGTLIALARDGAPVIGVLDQPVIGQRWVGVDGVATTFNGTGIATRSCASLAGAVMATSAPDYYQGRARRGYQRLNEITRWTVYGAGCHAFGTLAAGFVDLALEASHEPFDYCALVPIVSNAGGVITDWTGAPLTIRSGDRFVAAGDARIHAEALRVLDQALGAGG